MCVLVIRKLVSSQIWGLPARLHQNEFLQQTEPVYGL